MASNSLGVWLTLLGMLQWVAEISGYHPNSLEMDCRRYLHHIQNEPVLSPRPPDITGEWTSHRCEIRPGPEFLLRKYEFQNNSTFVVHQFHYSDPDCTNPLYSVSAVGRFRTVRQSWSVPGGTEVDYQMSRVTVMPYTTRMASVLEQRAEKYCSDINFNKWKPYETQDIFSFPGKINNESEEDNPPGGAATRADLDCTRMVDFTLHELQLMRLELRHRHAHSKHQSEYQILNKNNLGTMVEEELFLGDIHTDNYQRQFYRPSSYQIALKRSAVTSCGVCGRVANSDVFYPPELRHRRGAMVNLLGKWVSTRCESRPHGMFLTRELLFVEGGNSWHGKYAFYHDPLCRERSFTLFAEGNYVAGTPSVPVPGARHFDFKVNRVKITPNDQKTTDNMNGYKGKDCGQPKSWKRNHEQDVTHTNGCKTLGIRLPYIEYDIIKMEYFHRKSHLFIGQRPTDGRPISSHDRRPSSFQAPLVKCNSLHVALSYTKTHDRRDVEESISGAQRTHLAQLPWQRFCLALLLLIKLVKHDIV